MSRFYASIKGSAESEATRQGTSKSGISGHIRGQDIGIMVCSMPMTSIVDDKTEFDCFDIYVTGGSNNNKHTERIATVYLDTDRRRIVWVRTSKLDDAEVTYTLQD